jgi:non-ribosomal peptide synthetase component F
MLNQSYHDSLPASFRPVFGPQPPTMPTEIGHRLPRIRRRSGHRRTTHAFSREAMAGLSPVDQILFEHYGQGPIAGLPYNTIHRAFEAHVAANPHAIAAHHLDDSISYGELDRQANRLAALLMQQDVTRGDNVGLFLQRSIPMLVGILATLKVGAAYVPQHVGVAQEAQLCHIVDVASIKVILTISSLRGLVPVPDSCVCFAIDDLMKEPLLSPHPGSIGMMSVSFSSPQARPAIPMGCRSPMAMSVTSC